MSHDTRKNHILPKIALTIHRCIIFLSRFKIFTPVANLFAPWSIN